MFTWGITEMTGYVPKTTFYDDFTIADAFGPDAIKHTYNLAFNAWKDDVVYLTELVLVLNWKIWAWYRVDEKIARLYDSLWRKTEAYAYENLKDDDLDYYFRTTD